MAFDVGLVNRVAQEIESSGKRLQNIVNSPNELKGEIQKIQSSIESLKSLTEQLEAAGANGNTAQYTPNQNQS